VENEDASNLLVGPFSVIDKNYFPGQQQRKSSRCGFQKAPPQTKETKPTSIPTQAAYKKSAKKSATKKPVPKKPVPKMPAPKKPASSIKKPAAAKPSGNKRTRAPIVKGDHDESEAEAKMAKKVGTTQDESIPSTSRLQDYLELQAKLKRRDAYEVSRDAYEAEIKYEQSLRNNK
jgi:hypothetical protein